jgi:hypothetical protein
VTHLIRISVEAISEEDWAVAVSAPLGAAERRRLGRAEVESIRAATTAVLGRSPDPVFVHEADAAWDRCEELAGRALRDALLGHGAAARLFERLLTEAGREAVAVVLDTVGEPAGVPWELLTDGSGVPIEAAAGRLVVRMAAGPRRAPARSGSSLRVLLWVTDPSDQRVLARHAESLKASLAGIALVDAEPGVAVARVEPASLDVLHVMAHGSRVGEGFALGVPQGNRTAGGAAHGLAPILHEAAFTVLDVCQGAETLGDDLQGLTTRLVRAGTPACLGPARRCAARAALRMSEGMYGALAEGRTLLEAVAAGRRWVQVQGAPHPHHRWYNFQLHVADLGVLDLAIAPPSGARVPAWLVEGVEGDTSALAAQWAGAQAVSEQEGDGFVGLEHLLLADVVVEGPVSRSVRQAFALGPRRDRLVEELRHRHRLIDLPGDHWGTPWLREVLADPSTRGSVEAMWSAISAAWHGGWTELTGVDLPGAVRFRTGSEVMATASSARPAVARREPAGALAVVGGPEDGRRLLPEPGDTVGRAGGRATHLLYNGTRVVDAGVSREHLLWRGHGSIEAIRPVRRVAADASVEVVADGVLPVWVGDVLVLGSATRLRGVARGEHADLK